LLARFIGGGDFNYFDGDLVTALGLAAKIRLNAIGYSGRNAT
jgi:hypothetical protein